MLYNEFWKIYFWNYCHIFQGPMSFKNLIFFFFYLATICKLIFASLRLLVNCMSVHFNTLDDKSPLVEVMTWCCQAKSHCWPRSMSPYGVSRPQWGNFYWFHYHLLIVLFTGIAQGCGGNLVGLNGTFASLTDPTTGKYPARLDCVWNIAVEPSMENAILNLTFESASFALESGDQCTYDYIEVCCIPIKYH